MSQPPLACYIPGLFIESEYRVEARAWHDILRDNASACKLTRLEFCKTKVNKLHEFLILYFSHPTHTAARAVAVVDRRAVKVRSQSSVIISPSIASQNPAEALDRIHIMGQGDKLEPYLSKTYDQYEKLCVLRYPSAESDPSSLALPGPPSAVQLSTLLFVVTNHHPGYNLYKYNCYWYADTVFEACKSLFPGWQEYCNNHGYRGRCRFNIPMIATQYMHSLPDICEEYDVEWKKVMRRRKADQEIIVQRELERKLDKERSAHEAAQQEWKRKLDQERAAREAAKQEWERKLAEERRSVQQEWERKLEEERRVVQQEWKRMLEEERRAAQQELERKLEQAERRLRAAAST